MKKSLYDVSYTCRFFNHLHATKTKWELIRKFFSFLKDPEQLSLEINKINNILISQNQTWEYDENKDGYVLHTWMDNKENIELYNKDKFIDDIV